MKTSKLIAALLVMLGFAGCRPDELVTIPMYGTPDGTYMYGPPLAGFENKQVPDVDDTAVDMLSVEDKQGNDAE